MNCNELTIDANPQNSDLIMPMPQKDVSFTESSHKKHALSSSPAAISSGQYSKQYFIPLKRF